MFSKNFTTFSFFHSPRRPFLLVAPSSSSLLSPCSSFFLVQHCLNHLESIKGHSSLILTKAWLTDQRTNQRSNRRTDKASYRDARTHLKMVVMNTVRHVFSLSSRLYMSLYTWGSPLKICVDQTCFSNLGFSLRTFFIPQFCQYAECVFLLGIVEFTKSSNL